MKTIIILAAAFAASVPAQAVECIDKMEEIALEKGLCGTGGCFLEGGEPVKEYCARKYPAQFSTKSPLANLADRNDTPSLERLLRALKRAGVTVTIGGHSDNTQGFFRPAVGKARLHIYDNASDISETLKHEAMHVAQWCKGGKREMAEVGLSADEIEAGSLLFSGTYDFEMSTSMAYSRFGRHLEAEAETAARTNSLKGMAVVVEKFCK